MDIGRYVAQLRDDLAATAAPGDEQTQRTAALLGAAVEPAARLALIDALTEFAAEVSTALGDRTVEVRLDGRNVRAAVSPHAVGEATAPPPPPRGPGMDTGDISRITLRLVEQIKGQAEQAAQPAGRVAELVGRAGGAGRAVRPGPAPDRAAAPGGDAGGLTGWRPRRRPAPPRLGRGLSGDDGRHDTDGVQPVWCRAAGEPSGGAARSTWTSPWTSAGWTCIWRSPHPAERWRVQPAGAAGSTGREVRVEVRHDLGATGGWAQRLGEVASWLGAVGSGPDAVPDRGTGGADAVRAAEISWSDGGPLGLDCAVEHRAAAADGAAAGDGVGARRITRGGADRRG